MRVKELLGSSVEPRAIVLSEGGSHTASVTAFESAALTFGKPLVLPKYTKDVTLEPVLEPVAQEDPVVRVAKNYPVAKPTDLYRVAPLKDLHRICKEINKGLFVSNTKGAIWSEGGRFHHMNWDVKKLVVQLKAIEPATSLQIDQCLPTMDRYRVSEILRELRKQGLLIVN